MTDDHTGFGGQSSGGDDLIEIDLNFESMRRFQGEFSQNLSKDGLFIDTGEPLSPGSVIRFRVILPEDFVFLEGTTVIEWIRSAEDVSDGPPGMALRFVTLSPQNQELVEQLVQDHVDAGGSPFDLDVRPVPGDFPTDALEGAPSTSNEPIDESYRLTVRRTGPQIQAEALQALVQATPDAAPDAGEADLSSAVESEEVAVRAESHEAGPTESHGFEIVSSVPPGESQEADTRDQKETTPDEGDTEPTADSPKLDWSAEMETLVEAEESPKETATAPSDDEYDRDDETAEPPTTLSEILLTPSDFDDGPEVIDDVTEEDFGSPAFDVSLPEHDDEPDTTPLLPDEGRDDVSFHSEDEIGAPPRRRRLWPLGLVAVFLLAVAGGFLWPHAKDWLAARETRGTREPVAIGITDAEGESAVLAGEQLTTDLVERQEPSDEVAVETTGAGDQEVAKAEVELGDTSVEATAVGDQPESAPANVVLAKANTVTAIDVEPGPRGTVIRILGNGSLEDGVLSLESLPSPPRILIRVRGIASGYRPYTIEATTAEVSRVRNGHHEERRPPELWVVVDLTSSEIAVEGIDIRGNVAEIVIAHR
jgi:uncharacterized protein (TIGR02266 family)